MGLLLGGAALVKLYPAVLLAGVAGSLPSWRRRLWALAVGGGAAAALAAVAYVPHVADVGVEVLGYLPGYLEEERYAGGRFLIVELVLPPFLRGGLAATAVATMAMATVVALVVRRPTAEPSGFLTLFAALLVVTTPVQPWYAVTLLALATVSATPAAAAIVVAGYPYFFAVILDHPQARAIGQCSYGAAALVFAAGVTLSWRRRRASRRGPVAVPLAAPGP